MSRTLHYSHTLVLEAEAQEARAVNFNEVVLESMKFTARFVGIVQVEIAAFLNLCIELHSG